ncbi:MAG: xylulokinase, partial [Clostridiales bacterium]|nr:xylulokinase [Clostridiales bacterium]
ISGQMHGLVMLDQQGKVLRPSIIWADQRTAKECAWVEETFGRERLIEITCNPALTGFTLGKIIWVRDHEPDIYKQCRHILLPKDYLRYRLTGEFATEVSDASGMQLLDVPNRTWSQELLAAMDIDPTWLGKVYESPEITGYISAEASRETGLSTKTAVVGGAGDNAAAAVGTGVVREGEAFTTIGTSGVLFAHTDGLRLDPKGRAHTFCYAVPGAWHVMGVVQSAGLSLQWFRNNFYEKGTTYSQLDEQAALSPIGANRLLYAPYLMGERTPHLDADCRGAFVGLSAMHTKNDLARAVMEGSCFAMKDCQTVLAEMDVTPTQMALCGGGAKSPFLRQMLSDVYNLPTVLPLMADSAALGVAILAAAGTGLYPDVRTACDSILTFKDAERPDAERAARYDKVYQAYRTIYPGLRDTYRMLAGL